jgi:hypothetical protein
MLSAMARRAFFVTAILLASSPSLAERQAETDHDALTFEGASGLGWINDQNSSEPLVPYYFFAFVPSYRVSRELSLGGIVSYARPIGGHSGVRLWRLSGAGRGHAVRTRAVDVWFGGEIGLALSRFAPASCCAPAHVEPLLGGGLGVEVLSSPYVSIGAEWRGMLIAFPSGHSSSEPSGLSPAMFTGLTLGMHLPAR